MDQDFLPEDRYILEQKQRMNSFTEELSIKSVPSRRWQWVTGLFCLPPAPAHGLSRDVRKRRHDHAGRPGEFQTSHEACDESRL